jgi:hypothetical protein
MTPAWSPDEIRKLVRVEISGTFRWTPPKQSKAPSKPQDIAGTFVLGYRATTSAGTTKVIFCWHPSLNSNPENSYEAWPANPSQIEFQRRSYCGYLSDLKYPELKFRGGDLLRQIEPRSDQPDDSLTVVDVPLRFDFKNSIASELVICRFGAEPRATGEFLLPVVGPEQFSTGAKAVPNGLQPKIEMKISAACPGGEARKIFDIGGIHVADFEPALKYITDGEITLEARTLLAGLADLSKSTSPFCGKVITTIAKNKMRWVVGPIDASRLGNVGFLRSLDQNPDPNSEQKNLGVSLDNSQRLLIDAGSSSFWLVATAEWATREDCSKEFDANNSTKLQLEAAWAFNPTCLAGQYYTLDQLLRDANEQSRYARSSLKQVGGGEPESFLPEMSIPREASSDSWAAVKLYAWECCSMLNGIVIPNAVCPDKTGNIEPKSKRRTRCSMSLLSPFSIKSQLNPEKYRGFGGIATKLSVPGIGTSSEFEVWLEHDPAAEQTAEVVGDAIASFFIANRSGKTSPKWTGRLGALRLEYTRDSENKTNAGVLCPGSAADDPGARLVIAWPSAAGPLTRPQPNKVPRLSVNWKLRLNLTGVFPITADIPWGEREERPNPLVILEKRPKGGNSADKRSQKVPYAIDVTESIAPDRDRWMTANLIIPGTNAVDPDESYVLLSQQPWSIVRFTRRRLDQLGDAANAVVATFDSDKRTWLFKLVASEYHYQFPPQAVGESADKPRRLELHDLYVVKDGRKDEKVVKDGRKDEKNDEMNYQGKEKRRRDDVIPKGSTAKEVIVIRPAPADGKPGDPDRSYIVEFRLTPSLDLWIRPSDLSRNYFQPEWAAFEIFRQRNDFGLGVAFRALRGEFLYGMMVGIDVRRESSPAALARVAEIQAITGQMAPFKWTLSANLDLLKRWRVLRAALLSRHERLEVWSPFYDQPRPFAPAQFGPGVSFALRTTALHRSPTTPPIPDQSAGSIAVAKDQPGVRIDSSFGLAGGALWPMESIAFVRALQQNPVSAGGTIERIAISPTGGDADQSAQFLGGQLVIAGSTRAGFVQRQRVEILGRIGVFWHRAKHVIIYERTVNPSEQFAPIADAQGWNKSRSRRAILRKVSEFIELLQPIRSYPDIASDPKGASCGFLDSVRFNSKIINVDSAWAEDYPNSNDPQGYTLPLWNAGAAAQRPNVYPLPSISAVTVAEGKGDRPLAARQIANPENLYFYTQVPIGNLAPREFDSDKWPAAFGVDYGNLVDPALLEHRIAPGGDDHGRPGDKLAQGRKPSTPRVLPGHERFTWRLLPDGARTMLNSGLSAKPVYGNLDSLTFARCDSLPKPDADPSRLVAKNYLHSKVVSDLRDYGNVLYGQIAALNSGEPFKNENRPKPPDLTNLGHLDFEKAISAALNGDKVIDCDAVNAQIKTSLQLKQRLLSQSIRDWEHALPEKLNPTSADIKKAWTSSVADLRKRAGAAVGNLPSLSEPLNDVLSGAHSAVGAVRGQIAAAKIVVHDTSADLEKVIDRSASRIQSALTACERTLSWTPQRYNALRSQISSEIDALAGELNSVVTDACHRLGVDLGPVGAPLANKLGQQIAQQVANLVTKLVANADASLPKDVPALPDDVTKAVQKCAQAAGDLKMKVAAAEADLITFVQTSAKGIDDVLKGADELVLDAASAAFREVAVGPQLIANLSDSLLQEIENAAKSAADIPDELIKRFSDQLQLGVAGLAERIDNFDIGKPLSDFLKDPKSPVNAVCSKIHDIQKDIVGALTPDLPKDFTDKVKAVTKAYDDLRDAAGDLGKVAAAKADLEKAAKDLSGSVGAAQAYSGRVSGALSRFANGGLAAAPSNALNLISAATAAPEIGQLQANIDRLRCSYNQAKLETSKAMAAFSKLGDALKALGIEIPFNGLSDQLEFPKLSDFPKGFSFQRLFPNFGGLNLDNLFGDVEIPPGVRDAVKIRHDFDKATFRASVEVDVNVPISGRKQLFAVGPFAMYFRDSTLTGQVRAEASKDSQGATTSGSAEIATNIDVDITGETVVSLQSARLRYARETGLKFSFDARNIRLHSALKFVQDTLGGLIGDQIGGLKILKEQGVPIGVEHEFKLPTISLMAGTSGISNIQLGNTFRLLAYPDFVLSNRFNLSRPELPFLFSFFIVGGTGYIFLDASYRPFDRSLSVVVETAIGGSAALGFALGPISGSVFVAFSVVLTFRRTFGPTGSTGDGLSVGVLLVIAGRVSLWGIIEVYIGIMLRLTYQEDGGIDALGSVSVKIKICMFLTLSFSAQVHMRLKDGQKTTAIQSSTSVQEGERLKQMHDNATRLQGARA